MASPADIFGAFVDEPAPTALGPYERTVHSALADFAELYAEQNDLDYAALGAAGAILQAKGQISLAVVIAPGLMLLVTTLFMGAASGAHLNPGVSLAFAVRVDGCRATSSCGA